VSPKRLDLSSFLSQTNEAFWATLKGNTSGKKEKEKKDGTSEGMLFPNS